MTIEGERGFFFGVNKRNQSFFFSLLNRYEKIPEKENGLWTWVIAIFSLQNCQKELYDLEVVCVQSTHEF